MADLVGFGVAIATGTQFVLNFPERTYRSMLIPLMQEDGRAGNWSLLINSWTGIFPTSSQVSYFMFAHLLSGETTKKGFYLYDDKRRAKPDPELPKYIEKARGISGAAIDPKVTLSSFLYSSLTYYLTCIQNIETFCLSHDFMVLNLATHS